MNRFLKIFCVLLLPLSCSACAALTGVERRSSVLPDPELIELMDDLKTANAGLRSFKGIGRLRLWDPSSDQRFRAAWIGAEPEKLRIALMGISGHPLATMASNDQWVYLISHSDDNFYKKQSIDGSLKRLLGFPLTTRDIFQLLAGRLPVADFDSIRVESDSRTDERVVLLSKAWRGLQEKIHLSNTSGCPYKIERFDREGVHTLTVEYNSMNSVNGYQLPDSLTVTDPNGSGMHLEAERLWVNTPVSPEAFVLHPPDSAGRESKPRQ